MKTIEDLKSPDDIEGAVAIAKSYRERGAWGNDVAEPLYNVMADPELLMRRLKEEGFK